MGDNLIKIDYKKDLVLNEMKKSHADYLHKLSHCFEGNDKINKNHKNHKKMLLESAVLLNSSNERIMYDLSIFYIFQLGLESNGFELFEKCYDTRYVNNIIEINDKNVFFFTLILCRYLIDKKQLKRGCEILNIVSKSEFSKHDKTADVMLATLLYTHPLTELECKKMTQKYVYKIDELLKEKNLNIECAKFDKDPHLFCMFSPFFIESYYEFDFKEVMSKYVNLMIKLFPELNYTSKKLSNSKNTKKHIGIISAFWYDNTSVLCDFKGMIDKLSRNDYKFTYIYINTSGNKSTFLSKRDKNVIISDFNGDWLQSIRAEIENLDLDLLFYLEPTMSHHIQKLMLSKLAPIQIVSHGHPVTSGVSSEIIDYFVSWEAAELEYDISKTFYTEKLYLLSKNSIHQFYEPRTENGVSLINHMRYDNLERKDFYELRNVIDKNWYCCMQKPFKCHPSMIYMIQGILDKDNNSILILHKSEYEDDINSLENFFNNNDRVIFLNSLEHHLLLALLP